MVAPIAAGEGEPLRRIDDRYAGSVFPFLSGRSFAFGLYGGGRLRNEALDLVAALHRATPVVEDRAPAHALGFAGAADLAAFLAEPDRPWVAGPFGEQARRLLAERTTVPGSNPGKLRKKKEIPIEQFVDSRHFIMPASGRPAIEPQLFGQPSHSAANY